MKPKQYKIRFPAVEPHQLTQDEAYFYLEGEGEPKQIRFHDYAELYSRPGLYEELFYDRLKCNSPQKVAQILKKCVDDIGGIFTQLRVLDVGAGNGMMGETLHDYGVARLVGVDVLWEACEAAQRDRPGLYDAYYVRDLTNLAAEEMEDLKAWRLDCMTAVAALGFGDIPPKAFATSFNLIETNGWVVFNIKETFLDNRDTTGFSILVKQLILSEVLHLHHLERYRHRISIDGAPLFYYAVIGRKNRDIPDSFLTETYVRTSKSIARH